MRSPIFLSYRRDDTEGQAGRLFEDLRDEFGADNVFMDVATIEPGVDFRRVIDTSIESCGLLLALIGKNWLNVVDVNRRRRIDNPDDFVRLEIAQALRRDIPVVPVLVHGAQMPKPDELPEELQNLAFRNSVELTHARWESDKKPVFAALRKLMQSKEPVRLQRPAWLIPAAAVVVAVGLPSGWQVLHGTNRSTPVPAAAFSDVSTSIGKSAGPSADAAGVSLSAATRHTSAAQEPTAMGRSTDISPEADAVQQTETRRQMEPTRQADEQRAAQVRDHENGVCLTGFVWRDARPGDKVCVTPETRQRTVDENRSASLRHEPAGGPYGAKTCRQGYVWREAFVGDATCVPPESRQAAAADNRLAAQRIVPLPTLP
jgi:TIR domain